TRTALYGAVPTLRQAGELDVEVVLVGPEPRHLGVRPLGLAQDRLADMDALVLRVLPGFEPDAAADQRVGMAGRVAGGEDRRVAGAAVGVDRDALFDPGARGFGAR